MPYVKLPNSPTAHQHTEPQF